MPRTRQEGNQIFKKMEACKSLFYMHLNQMKSDCSLNELYTHPTCSVSPSAVSFWLVWDTLPVRRPFGFLTRCLRSTGMKAFVPHVSRALFTCEHWFKILSSFVWNGSCVSIVFCYFINIQQILCFKELKIRYWQMYSNNCFPSCFHFMACEIVRLMTQLKHNHVFSHKHISRHILFP